MTSPTPTFNTVCGRTIHNDPRYYTSAEYQGRTIHFCTEFCLEAFRADPERFYIAHSRPKLTGSHERLAPHPLSEV